MCRDGACMCRSECMCRARGAVTALSLPATTAGTVGGIPLRLESHALPVRPQLSKAAGADLM
eukprot:2596192-Prymnesium_polylepis.2